jgi:hypothetical protein
LPEHHDERVGGCARRTRRVSPGQDQENLFQADAHADAESAQAKTENDADTCSERERIACGIALANRESVGLFRSDSFAGDESNNDTGAGCNGDACSNC